MSRAYEMVSDEVKKSGRYANMAVLEDTVFKWVQDYYLTDDREKEAERRTEAEEAFHKRLSVQINTPKGNKNKTTKKRNASKKNKAGGANSNASERKENILQPRLRQLTRIKTRLRARFLCLRTGLAE